MSDECIKNIIMYYKDEMKEKLIVALETFKNSLEFPFLINNPIGERK